MASERVTLPIDVSPTHYSLELTPNLENLEFYCNEVIDVDVTKAGVSEVTLHSKEIFIETVTFKSAGSTVASPTVVEINYNTQYHTVKFLFDGPLPEGQGHIFIKFRGILNGDMCGFYKSTYSDANGNKKVMASTQFEALDARRYATRISFLLSPLANLSHFLHFPSFFLSVPFPAGMSPR